MKNGTTHIDHKHHSHVILKMYSCNSCCMRRQLANTYTLRIMLYVCYAQSMQDQCNPWMCLHKVAIGTLCKQTQYGFVANPWSVCLVLCTKYVQVLFCFEVTAYLRSCNTNYSYHEIYFAKHDYVKLYRTKAPIPVKTDRIKLTSTPSSTIHSRVHKN